MNKIASLLFCCSCFSFVTAELLGQLTGSPCPRTTPHNTDCTVDSNCTQHTLFCDTKREIVTMYGLFGSMSTNSMTESKVDHSSPQIPCYKWRPCHVVNGVCVVNPVPWTTVNSNIQYAAYCP